MLLRSMTVLLCLLSHPLSAEILNSPPEVPDKNAKYFFFMHGSGLYKHNIEQARQNWQDKVHAIANYGFTMITEERKPFWDNDYGVKIATYVDTLLKKGVPAKHITVGGYSRGARIALEVSNIVSNSGVNYFLLAGCYNQDIYGKNIKGHILSVYDSGDLLFNTCSHAFNIKEGIIFKEVIVRTGYGHSMGAKVRNEWLEPMLEWLK